MIDGGTLQLCSTFQNLTDCMRNEKKSIREK
jgi:hypothetical protein